MLFIETNLLYIICKYIFCTYFTSFISFSTSDCSTKMKRMYVVDTLTLEQITGQQYMFACKKCGRAYKRKSSLYNHSRWECGKEPQFKCSYCPYKGKQKIHFIMHVMAKHKEHKHEVLNSAYNRWSWTKMKYVVFKNILWVFLWNGF